MQMRNELQIVSINTESLARLMNNMQDNIEETEVKLQYEITEKIRDLRDQNERKHANMELRLTRTISSVTENGAKAVSLCERVTQRNHQKFQEVLARQDELENRVMNLGVGGNNVLLQNRPKSLKLNPKIPTFGKYYSPMKFLSELRDFWTAVNPEREEAAFMLGSCLKGPPKDWWDLVKENGDDLDSFCVKFKERLWSENAQYEVKRRLEFGDYNPSTDINMSNYTIKVFRDSRNLTPPLSDSEIIRKMSRHFNEEIRIAILGRKIETLNELLELLERFDTSGPLNTKRTEGTEPKNENRRSRGRKTRI